jgi:asparagine synthase (glutamine-hydrolysing)
MCGIAGISGTTDRSDIGRMTASLRHRGPDVSGVVSSGPFHLGATRLSIVGLDSPAQPLFNETGTISLVFNGEIYNHRALRAELEARGHRFSTSTDSEVVLHLYEELGERCVGRLHGMFAFAVADGDRMLLARDRLGIKPLYYTQLTGGEFLFASEVKALLQYPGFTPRLDRRAFAHYLILRHSVGSETFFEDVSLLPPGHIMTVKLGEKVEACPPRRYYETTFERDLQLSLEEAEERLYAILSGAVRSHLTADVEVGITLSGGLDSAVMALLALEQAGGRLETFTVGDSQENTDVQQAQALADRIGARHHVFQVEFEDYVQSLPAMLAAEEKPSNLFGLPLFLLCRGVARHRKACLHGEGADELFGGYEDYVDPDSRLSFMRQRLPALQAWGVVPDPKAVAAMRRLAGSADMDEYLERIFRHNFGDPLEQQHLIPVDKMAMAWGLELRVPYLADEVYEFVNRLPIPLLVRSDLGVGKYLLKRLALKRFGADAVDMVLREKHGFPTAGMRYLRRFDQLCDDRLPADYLESHEFGACFRSKRELLSFEIFCEIFFRHRGDAAAAGSTLDFMARRGETANVSMGE